MRQNYSMKKKTIIVTSSTQSLTKKECSDCGSVIISSAKDNFCALCGSQVKDKNYVVNLHASVEENLEPKLKCSKCNEKLFTDIKKDKEELISMLYCTVCGSDEVEVYEEPTEVEDVAEVEEEPENDEDFEYEEEVEEEPEDEEGSEYVEEDVEEDVQETLNEEDFDVDEMEASFLNKPEPTWVMFKAGVPFIRIRQSLQPEESHAIFASGNFFDIFKNRIKETSLFATLKEFNADVLDEEEVMTPNEMEEVVYDRLQSHVIPKFLECVNTAIEGMTRNVFPELNAELKASFYDELKARGITNPYEIVESTFDSAGSSVFTAVVAKAMVLFNKPEEIFEELKSTIFSTNKVRTKKENEVTSDDLEALEVKAKLIAGNLPITNNEVVSKFSTVFTQASVEDVKNKIQLRR